MADHALNLMFRPYKGSVIQLLAAFLTKGAIKGEQLFYVIIEAILLLERAGFFVDSLTTGASWNGAMRNKFGVTVDQVYSEHLADPNRKLWFITDFQHIIKLMKSRIILKKKLQVKQINPNQARHHLHFQNENFFIGGRRWE